MNYHPVKIGSLTSSRLPHQGPPFTSLDEIRPEDNFPSTFPTCVLMIFMRGIKMWGAATPGDVIIQLVLENSKPIM